MNNNNNRKKTVTRSNRLLKFTSIYLIATGIFIPWQQNGANHKFLHASGFDHNRDTRRNARRLARQTLYNNTLMLPIETPVYTNPSAINDWFTHTPVFQTYRNLNNNRFLDGGQIPKMQTEMSEMASHFDNFNLSAFRNAIVKTADIKVGNTHGDSSYPSRSNFLYSGNLGYYNYLKYMNTYRNQFLTFISKFHVWNDHLSQAELNNYLNVYKTTYLWGSDSLSKNRIVGVKQVGNYVLPVIQGDTNPEASIHNNSYSSREYYGPAYVMSSFDNTQTLKTIIPNFYGIDSNAMDLGSKLFVPITANGVDVNAFKNLYTFITLDQDGKFVDTSLSARNSNQADLNTIHNDEWTNVNVDFGNTLITNGLVGSKGSQSNVTSTSSMYTGGSELSQFANSFDYFRKINTAQMGSKTYKVVINDGQNTYDIATITDNRWVSISGADCSKITINQTSLPEGVDGQLTVTSSNGQLVLGGLRVVNNSDQLLAPTLNNGTFTFTLHETVIPEKHFITEYRYAGSNKITTVVDGTNGFKSLTQDNIQGHKLNLGDSNITFDQSTRTYTRYVVLDSIESKETQTTNVVEHSDDNSFSDDRIGQITRDHIQATVTNLASVEDQEKQPLITPNVQNQLQRRNNEPFSDYLSRMLRLGYYVIFNDNEADVKLQKIAFENSDEDNYTPWHIVGNIPGGKPISQLFINEESLTGANTSKGYYLTSIQNNEFGDGETITINVRKEENLIAEVRNSNGDILKINNEALVGHLHISHDSDGRQTIAFQKGDVLEKYYNISFTDNEYSKIIFTPKIVTSDENSESVSFKNDFKIFEISVNTMNGNANNYDIIGNLISNQIGTGSLLHGDSITVL